MMEPIALNGRAAVVTGAGRGLGREMAIGLARAGADVAVLELDADAGSDTCREIEGLGVRAVSIAADVSDVRDVETGFAQVASALGRLDILVNNAGISRVGPETHETTDEDWLDSVSIMQSGVFFCMRAASRQMIRQGGGSIVNISSIRGYSPRRGRFTYGAPKAAVIMMSRIAASEWGRYGIRVNAVAPGFIKTPMHDLDVARGTFDETTMLEAIPLGRFGRAEELADLVVFLCSDRGAYITGSCVTIDGGLTTMPAG